MEEALCFTRFQGLGSSWGRRRSERALLPPCQEKWGAATACAEPGEWRLSARRPAFTVCFCGGVGSTVYSLRGQCCNFREEGQLFLAGSFLSVECCFGHCLSRVLLRDTCHGYARGECAWLSGGSVRTGRSVIAELGVYLIDGVCCEPACEQAAAPVV